METILLYGNFKQEHRAKNQEYPARRDTSTFDHGSLVKFVEKGQGRVGRYHLEDF